MPTGQLEQAASPLPCLPVNLVQGLENEVHERALAAARWRLLGEGARLCSREEGFGRRQVRDHGLVCTERST